MLSITMHDEPDLATLVLEGRLSGPWVDEFQHCYQMLSMFPHRKSVVIDLSGVTSTDAAGEDVLLEIRQDGAQLVAGKPPGELSLQQVQSLCPTSASGFPATTEETPKSKTPTTSIQDDIRNSGGQWVDREVVRDRNWVSSRQPSDLPAFNREMIALFGAKRASGHKS